MPDSGKRTTAFDSSATYDKIQLMGGTHADGGGATRQFGRAFAGTVLALVALGLWSYRDGISSWFAASYTTSIGFKTQNKGDDLRLQRAFAAVQSAQPNEATFELEPGFHPFRDVQVTGTSRAAAVAAAEALSKAIVAAFNAEGPDTLSVSVRRRGHALPGPTTDAIKSALAYGGPVLALAGIALLWLGWRDWPAGAMLDRMPRMAAFGALGVMAFGVLPFVMPGWVFMALFAMAIPAAIFGVIIHKMQQVRRTANWPSAQGRIVHSQMRTVRREKADAATKVGNVPAVEYVYSVNGVEYHGKRIGIGEIPADSPQAEAALERYQVGRTGPVFYNPDKPEEAVLERDPPARPAVVYGVAALVMLVGLAVVVTFTQARAIIEWLQPYFPPGAVVQGVLFCGAAGLLMLLFLASERRAATAATRWPTATGTILSSFAESHRTLVPRGRGQTVVVWSPVVEYNYRVLDRDYHGSRVAFGAAAAGARELAEMTVARYPVGQMVAVHFNPATPSVAVLEPRVAFNWSTLLVTIAFFAAAVFFSGWRGFLP